MKILHWPTVYPDPKYGSPFALIFIQEHIQCISAEHEQVVFYLSPNPPQQDRWIDIQRCVEKNVKVIRVHLKKQPQELLQRVWVYGVVSMELLRLWFSGFYPELIHIHIFSGGRIPTLLGKILKIPTVVSEHWSELCLKGKLSPKRLLHAKEVYSNAKILLPVSENLFQCIEERTGKTYPYRIIRNAVDCSIFQRLEVPNSQHQTESKFRILTVARLDEIKDIPTLLRSMKGLGEMGFDYQLDIIGKGNPRPLQELSRELGIGEQVTFWGEQPKTRIAEMMQRADVFVLSSLWENSPCVIGEALCCGLPVVATAVGGVPELVHSPDLGRLVPPRDPRTLAEGIADVLMHLVDFNKEQIAETGFRRFSYEIIGKQLEQVYQEVLHSDRQA